MLFHPYSAACCISRSLASVDHLALQESYFNRLHNSAQYFVLLTFDWLKSVYVSPIQWKYNIDFFAVCTVSTSSFVLHFKRALLMFLCVVCFQEFIFCILPFIFWTALDTSDPSLSFPALHHLLEEFIPQFYYSEAYPSLQTFLSHACQFCNSAVKSSALSVVKTQLVLAHGQDFKYDSTEVHFHFVNYFF